MLIDRTRPVHTRCLAAAALRAVAEARPLLRSDSVSGLCWVLGPRYTRTVADEDVAAAAVGELQNLGAAEALPRIEAAYARDAVTPTVTSLADVYAALAPDAEPPVAAPPAERSLPLSCMVCGRTRRHEVRGYALGANLVGGAAVAELDPAERKLHERYRALAIAHPVRCPHCRAVNRYRVGAWTLVEVTAHLGEGSDGAGGSAVGHPPWVMADFAGSVGRVHPAVTAHRLRSRLRANPADHACRVRCANALRMCGRWAEAEAAYRRVAAAPRASGAARQEAEFNLALLAAAADRRKEAAQWCRLALGEVPTDRLPALTSALPVGAPVSGREETMLRPMLAKLHDPGAFEAREWYDDLAVPWRGLLAAQYFVAQPAARGRKVGRNEPCPCGSGRKYKRCCGA